MTSLVAVTRPVSASFDRCELTHLERVAIDVDRARRQHAAYEATLESVGCRVERLPAADDLPDAVFVEDTAVVLDELAVITRPGAASRRAETPDVEAALSVWRPTARIQPPGTLDGGDVLRLGRRLFVGLSQRSNREGIRQLEAIVQDHGYLVAPVAVTGCLHLKTAVTAVGDELILANAEWLDGELFESLDRVDVDPAEPFAANALWLGGADVILPAAFPATAQRLESRGLAVHPVDVSEIAKAEGGVTCCSLVFAEGPAATTQR